MLLYIDALFKKRGCQQMRASAEGACAAFTADDAGIRDTPPYTLVPSVIMTSDESGDVSVFSGADAKKNLETFGNHIMTLREYPVFVGWYLDQVIVPCIVSNAMLYGAQMPSWLTRNLNDKWSKTVGHSVERAFLQGWYPSSHGDATDKASYLTLDQAASLCGEDTPDARAAGFGEGLPDEVRTLGARIATIGALFARYHDAVASGGRK